MPNPYEQVEQWLLDGTLSWVHLQTALKTYVRKVPHLPDAMRDLAAAVVDRGFSNMQATVGELEIAYRRGENP